jgi:hypothetical protein
MKRYAVLDQDANVVNIILAATTSIAEQVTGSDCVHIPAGTNVNLGYVYSNGAFLIPEDQTIPE